MQDHTIKRRYDIDWLRNISILLLFPFHTARVFDVWDPFYVKYEDSSWLLSWFIVVTGYWFMPLLFWLAGSSSLYALHKRTSGQYMKERMTRLFIPFLFGLLLIIPPQGYVATLHHTGENVSYFTFLKQFFSDYSDLSGYYGSFTPAHLWFILYLFVISVIALPILLTYLKSDKLIVSRWNKKLSQPVIFVLLSIILLITQAFPAPGGQNPFTFLFIFIVGFITASDSQFQAMFNKLRLKALIGVILLIPVHILLIKSYLESNPSLSIDILMSSIRSLIIWLSLIAILGYGHKLFNHPNKAISYLNEAAFPIYIVHQTVLVLVAFFIVKLQISMSFSFVSIMLISLSASFLLYEFIIKRTTFTRWMFGLKMNRT